MILSSDERGRYTIETCGLARDKLCDARLVILTHFMDRLLDICLETDRTLTADLIDHEVKQFVREAKDESKEFLGFRRFVVRHLLGRIIKGMVSEVLSFKS